MTEQKLFELDLGYNPKLVEKLKMFHAQFSETDNQIIIKIPFSCKADKDRAATILIMAVQETKP